MAIFETIGSPGEFGARRREWNDAVDRYALATPFLTHEWLSSFFEWFGDAARLNVLLARDGDRIVGAAPLLVERQRWKGVPVRVVRFPTDPLSLNVRSDFVLAGEEDGTIDAFAGALASRRREWDVCVLDSVPEGSPLLARLPGALRKAGLFPLEPELYWVLHYLPLEGTWEGYMKGHSGHSREHLKREEKKLRTYGAPEVAFPSAAEDVERAVEAFFEIERVATKRGRDNYTPLDDRIHGYYRSLFRLLAGRGESAAAVLRLDGEPAAVILAARHRRTIYTLNDVYHPKFHQGRPGHVLRGALVRNAWESGLAEIDFNGYGSHIQRWRTTGRRCFRLLAFSDTAYGRLLRVSRRIASPLARKALSLLGLGARARPGDRGIGTPA